MDKAKAPDHGTSTQTLHSPVSVLHSPFQTQPSPRVGVIGLGYVGLPLAVAFAGSFGVVGYDHDPRRIADLQRGHDRTGQVNADELARQTGLFFSENPADLATCTVFILTVPTPVDAARRPDLGPLLSASETVGALLKPGDVVVYESTVYPGCTEDDCVPVLERASGLRCNQDFTVGYSPERLSPGDGARPLTDIVKITSGSTPQAAGFVDDLYGKIIRAGTYPAASIRVAEAAKVIENAQRDVNISFVNELALLFDRLGLNVHEVLAAAATKWNFLPFRPGLVGGHCISVDPYYLLHKAEEVGYTPQVIASGRRVNDSIPQFLAGKLAKRLLRLGHALPGARVLVLGVTYKENCPDVRNSRVADLCRELAEWGVDVHVHDPRANPADVTAAYGLTLCEPSGTYQAVLRAVNHTEFSAVDWKPFGDENALFCHLSGPAETDWLSLW